MGSVLLTGASGFVGHAVLEALKSRGHEVVCVLRPGSEARLDVDPSRVILTDDLFAETAEWWAQACAGIDMVIHVAWYVEPGKYLTSNRNMDCLTGTMALAQGAAATQVRRFVGVGTCFEYDFSDGYLSPAARLAPATPYAAAKAACFTMLNEWLPLMGVSFLWARLFYLHGAREDARRLVPYLHQQLASGEGADLTSGTQLRDYMDVADAAALLVDDALGTRTGATNICSETPVTIRALAESIADQYGRRDLLRFGARPDNLTDPPVIVGRRDGGKP